MIEQYLRQTNEGVRVWPSFCYVPGSAVTEKPHGGARASACTRARDPDRGGAAGHGHRHRHARAVIKDGSTGAPRNDGPMHGPAQVVCSCSPPASAVVRACAWPVAACPMCLTFSTGCIPFRTVWACWLATTCTKVTDLGLVGTKKIKDLFSLNWNSKSF
jgi:hypothetical protein